MRPILAAIWLGFWIPSSASASEVPAVRFVRSGISVAAAEPVLVYCGENELPVETVTLSSGKQLVLFDWEPETEYGIQIGRDIREVYAPRAPEPLPICRIELEDVSGAVVGSVSPDTVVRFRPNSRQLAIGSFGGWLRIVDCMTGKVHYQEHISEGIVKQIAWSPDGRQLYVGEQSPDAHLTAYRIERTATPAVAALHVTELWQVRLADELETSRLPANNRFGIYTLPEVSDLHVADDGRLFVAGRHSWPSADGMQNRGLLYCFASNGELIWTYPEAATLPLTITHIAIDPGGHRLLFMPMQTQRDARQGAVHPGTLYLLDAQTGRLASQFTPEPLRPHFDKVESWDSVTLSKDASRGAVGLADGRVLLFDLSDGSLALMKTFELATPTLIGRVPINAPASYARFLGARLYMQTQSTYIPFGSTGASQQAPARHQGANTISVADPQGDVLWRYRGPYALSGFGADLEAVGGAARWVATACRQRPGVSGHGQFGFILFDAQFNGGGRDRLLYHYPTDGPVAADFDVSRDGRFIAVVETPAREDDRLSHYGNYQVHVVH